jgi:lipoic acid synthetase
MEPFRVAAAARLMKLDFVVLTSVDRDDLPDGGAEHFAATVAALRKLQPAPAVEVLTPDFLGRFDSLRVVVESGPDVFNHNVETVPRLYPRVRRGARLDRSLGLLSAAKILNPSLTTKSGLMVGLGEAPDEVEELLRQLRAADVDIVTIGQYLRPSRENLPVEEYVHPEVFEKYRAIGERLGFRNVFSGPFVRSSYRAEEALAASRGAVGNAHP